MPARRSQVRVFVRDQGLLTLNLPGGDIWKFTRRVANETEELARTIGPHRTWRMLNTMQVSVTPLGTLGCQGNVVVKVPYGLYVMRGTGDYHGAAPRRLGPYWPRHPRARVIYPSKGKPLKGQKPNPFLERALKIVVATI